MHHVLLGEDAAPAVQQEPVKAILKSIGVHESRQDAAQESGKRGRHKQYRDQHENCTRKQRCDQVIPLYSESLRSVLGPNNAVSV